MSAWAEYISWLFIVLVQLGFIAASVVCYVLRNENSKNYYEEIETGLDALQRIDLEETFDSHQKWYLAGIIVFALLACGFACCLCFGFRSLKIAIDVIDASADFVNKTKRIVLVPLLHFFLMIFVVAIGTGGIFCVLSLNEITPSQVIPQVKNIKWESQANFALFMFMIFGIIWICAWLEYAS